MSQSPEKQNERRLKIINRKARHEYFVLERLEAGIELLGTEVKSVRDGMVDLAAGFAVIEKGQAILRDVHIKPYEFGHQFNHDPRRPRRLLLHKGQIRKLTGQLVSRGATLIPLSIYLNDHGLIKIELALCRGKHASDKRETMRRETDARETARAIARHSGR